MIDLHIHTNASSDGQHKPREIFEMARQKGLRAIAFADHNSIANVEEGLRLSLELGIEFIPSLELNTFYQGLDLHILGYFIDPQDQLLKEWLAEIHLKKWAQAEKRVQKLNELGFVFSWDDLRKFSGDQIPTGMSFLQAILSRPENANDPRLHPYIKGERSNSPFVNFYRDYLRGGKPAFVPMEDISTLEAIQRLKSLGSIPILAHPSDTGEDKIIDLIGHGLAGLEVYSPYHSKQEQENFRIFAERRGLLITAGSDFHGKQVKPDVELGGISGNNYDLVSRLKEFLRNERGRN
ncbi:MAG: PHP domain-containing protein [Thermodesulfobacteriota bacterium]